jgi:hypothetical protein
MTYIFDTGGYLPNKDHCLMIGGKHLSADQLKAMAEKFYQVTHKN